jgi:molecular chaperone GrpE
MPIFGPTFETREYDVSDTTDPTAENGEATNPDASAAASDAPSREATLEAERDKLKDQLLRTAADFENYRRRARKDVEDAERRAREDVLRDVLQLVDNLERAVQASESATDVVAVAEGVRLVLRSFDDIAQRVGLERLAVVGERFDPNLHDAVQQVESTDHEPGTVITEVLGGYRVGQKLLRAALVVVAKAPVS